MGWILLWVVMLQAGPASDLSSLVAPGAEVVKLGTGMGFTEGPVWMPSTSKLVFSDIPASKLMQWTESDGVAPLRASENSNGNLLDLQGRLLSCQHGARNVVRYEEGGEATVLAERFEGKRFNSPNDIAVRSDGSLWFTDPPWGLANQAAGRELPGNWVFRLEPDTGAVRAVIRDLAMPNGIAFSPDETRLYVADTGGHPSHPDPALRERAATVSAYAVSADGTLIPDPIWRVETGCDGMCVDVLGNVYTTSGPGVTVFAPGGGKLGTIRVDESPANVCFGGPDFKTLFITARTSLYSVEMQVAGSRPSAARAGAPAVTALAAPRDGFRPCAVLDDAGTLHVVEWLGARNGEFVYLRRAPGAAEFSAPIPVAKPPGIVAGFDIAVGKDGRVHVLMRTTPKYSKMMDPDDEKIGFFDLKYMLYTRLNDAGDGFEPVRNLAGKTVGFEGVGTILADGADRVLAFWHGQYVPEFDESSRQIFRALSTDGGRTFGEPQPVRMDVVGACQCCGVAGTLGQGDEVVLAFRSSSKDDEGTPTKDSFVLTSSDFGATFSGTLLEPWEKAGCPGSLGAVASGPAGAFVAWRTRATVRLAQVGSTDLPVTSTPDGNARAPVIVCNSSGHVLFVWAVAGGPGSKGAGDLAWQVFDKGGNPVSLRGTLQSGVAAGWGAPAAYAEPDGDFVILYDGAGE